MKDAPLDPRTIQIVARHLTNWEQLARYLQLTGAEMEDIKCNYPTHEEQKYQCIMHWANENGKAGAIQNTLWHIDFNKSLVIKIEKDQKRKGTYSV